MLTRRQVSSQANKHNINYNILGIASDIDAIPFSLFDSYYKQIKGNNDKTKSLNNRKRKERFPREPLSMFYVTKSIYPYRLRKTDCLVRANISTSTTLCAEVWVD